jgi:hypothetical protein
MKAEKRDITLHVWMTMRLCLTYFSLMGTMIYFFLNRSTFEVHLRTLWYPSSKLS